MQARLEAQDLFGQLSTQAQACVRLQAWWRLQGGSGEKAVADLSFLLGCYPKPGQERGRLRALCAHALVGAQRPVEALQMASLAKEDDPRDILVKVNQTHHTPLNHHLSSAENCYTCPCSRLVFVLQKALRKR